MFNGIVQDIGKITVANNLPCDNATIVIRPNTENFLSGTKIGNSILCSGICLTVTDCTLTTFSAVVSQETSAVTNAKNWQLGTYLNLEHSMQLQDRVNGHMVQGHVDAICTILFIEHIEDSHIITLECSVELKKYLTYKSSIALDGVSLTLNKVSISENGEHSIIQVNIIPHTWQHTTFQYNKELDQVNLETDMIARYLEGLLHNKYPNLHNS